MATQVRRDYQLRGCFGALSLLVARRLQWPDLIKHNGLRVIVDVLGPPPAGVAVWEFMHYRLWERHQESAMTLQGRVQGAVPAAQVLDEAATPAGGHSAIPL
jgi:hypothetical protein